MSGQISRRSFVAAAGAAVVGSALLGGARESKAGEFTGRIKKAVKYNMIEEKLSLTDKFKMLKDLGYDGVELRFQDEVDRQEAVKAIEVTGLPIHGVVLGSVNGIPDAIDLAKYYGATSVLLVAGRVEDNSPYAENYTKTQTIIAEAVEKAEQSEIRLLVENVWNNFLLSPLEMAKYLDELKSEWVGAYFDVGNVVRFGWPEHWIPVLGNRIHKLDIKEYCRKKQNDEGLWKGFNVEIGEGSVNWAAVRAELNKIGYNGWATAEVGGGDRERLATIAKQMDAVLDL